MFEAEVVKDIFVTLLSLAGTIVAAIASWFLTEKVGAERVRKANELLEKIQQEFFLKETWVKEAVRYAEEKLSDLPGSRKFDAVMDFVSKKAQEHGIDISRVELEVLIESQLHKLKQELRDTWLGIITDPAEELEEETPEAPSLENPQSESIRRMQEIQEMFTPEEPLSPIAEVHKQSVIFSGNLSGEENLFEKIEGPQDGADLNLSEANSEERNN